MAFEILVQIAAIMASHIPEIARTSILKITKVKSSLGTAEH